MENNRSDPNARIRIGGIKISPELVQFDCKESPGTDLRARRFLRLLAANRINMPFLCFGALDRKYHTTGCVSAEEFSRAQHLLDNDPELRRCIDRTASVGSLTLYPHRSSMALLGRVLRVLVENRLPIYAVGTSISAITFNTDYRQMDRALAALEKGVSLPPNHAPFRTEPDADASDTGHFAESRHLETIAVYWEPKIKTYGIAEKTDLFLFRFSFPVRDLARWGAAIEAIGKAGGGFLMAVLQTRNGRTVQICLLLDRGGANRTLDELDTAGPRDGALPWQVASPVELLYFQGPHFKDRYGIAETAFEVLAQNRLPVLAAGCTGASIYLVLPENRARRAAGLLSEFFVTPHAAEAAPSCRPLTSDTG